MKIIKPMKNDPYPPPIYELGMAFVKGDKQSSIMTRCRESLCKVVNKFISNKGVWHDVDVGLDTNNTSLLLVYRIDRNSADYEERAEHYVECMKNAIRALNIIEETCGIRELSTIETVVHNIHSSKVDTEYTCTWLLTGSIEWMVRPQLLSFMMLIVRSIIRTGQVINASTMDAIDIYMKDLFLKCNYTDMLFLKKVWEKGLFLVTHRDEIFEGVTMKDSYSSISVANEGLFGVYSGIGSFFEEDKFISVESVQKAKLKFKELYKDKK